MKKIFIPISLVLLLFISACSNQKDSIIEINTLVEERGGEYTIEGNVITALGGSTIDFNLITEKRYGFSIDVTDFQLNCAYKLNDDVEDYYEDETGFVVFRKDGKITTFRYKPEWNLNGIKTYHIGKDDEAEIEVIGKKEDGSEYKETYIIKYYCNCDKED